ncbi:hypothetical protein BV898_12980 [Hypsibius exemplaris]|uniref:Transforming acidic coiled-coil-containing protein C-terminal domain-containing protein n=1 Tax=Hypsibius exemplaris TaxID=2072580 RepID=A0A1W0WC17_HYPEX|nr:hypothetical protein BV898_12980 [Hypsibius exemplaris]
MTEDPINVAEGSSGSAGVPSTQSSVTDAPPQPVATHHSSLPLEDRPLPAQLRKTINLGHINSQRGSSKSPPVDIGGGGDAPQPIPNLSNSNGDAQAGQFSRPFVNSRRGSESPVDVRQVDVGVSDGKNFHTAPESKIMEDSLADAGEVFGVKSQGDMPPGGEGNEAAILAAATMEDSLNMDCLRNNGPTENNREFYMMHSDSTAGSGQQHEDDLATQKRHMEANNAIEIFNDPGMDFLANAGSKSGVHESELARQSFYQNFDPFVGKSAAAVGQPGQHRVSAPTGLMGSPAPPGAGAPFRQAYPMQSHTATTDMISAMQQKQNAIRRQQAATTDRLLQPAAGVSVPLPEQPSSWPDIANRGGAHPSPFTTATATKNPTQQTPSLAPRSAAASQPFVTPPPHNSVSSDITNGSGELHHAHMINGEAHRGGEFHDDYELHLHDQSHEQTPPPSGSLVNLVDSSPRRPVTLRTKHNNNSGTSSATKQQYRRSVPAGFLDGREGLMGAGSPMETHEEYSGYPELNPVWENVLATYEGLLRVTLNKLSSLQAESAEARAREAKAVKDQEEMHKVFVGLHERFESSKTVIAAYRTNQETMQRAFDDLNSEFQPVVQENKRMQAAMRMNEMKMRAMEGDLEKKRDEIAELTKIVDDLIGKDP